jgi:hypothetical protein
LGWYIEWDVEHEQVGYRLQGPQESDVVFDVLKNIKAEKQVVMFVNVFGCPEPKFDSRGSPDHPNRFWRRIIPDEPSPGHAASDRIENATRPAAYVDDWLRADVLVAKKWQDLPRFPGGVGFVPVRVAGWVAAIVVHSLSVRGKHGGISIIATPTQSPRRAARLPRLGHATSIGRDIM